MSCVVCGAEGGVQHPAGFLICGVCLDFSLTHAAAAPEGANALAVLSSVDAVSISSSISGPITIEDSDCEGEQEDEGDQNRDTQFAEDDNDGEGTVIEGESAEHVDMPGFDATESTGGPSSSETEYTDEEVLGEDGMVYRLGILVPRERPGRVGYPTPSESITYESDEDL
jgi:hypothetical protein